MDLIASASTGGRRCHNSDRNTPMDLVTLHVLGVFVKLPVKLPDHRQKPRPSEPIPAICKTSIRFSLIT